MDDFASKIFVILDKYEAIKSKIGVLQKSAKDVKEIGKILKEYSELEPLVEKINSYLDVSKRLKETYSLMNDVELSQMAKDEISRLEPIKESLEKNIRLLLLPKDPNDDKEAYLEIRAGTGGDESTLFVAELFRSYMKYAEQKKWSIKIISSSEGSLDGYKEIIALIKGAGVYGRLKYEGGVHRVQRVPATESQGRVHTSAITVAIVPKNSDVEVDIPPKDIKIDTMRASGHGGQSVNTTDSAIRITHIPTGVVVTNQDEKSQHKNKSKAMDTLKRRLYRLRLDEQIKEESKLRKSQVNTGDRSDKIRTYNYPQNRITDHRIKLSLYKLSNILQEGLFDHLIDPLILYYQTLALKDR